MRLVFSVALIVATTTAASADILPLLSTTVNEFGVPAVGTGIAVYVDTDGTQPVTAQNWLATGNIVNIDTVAAAGVMGATNPPPRLQRLSETTFANLLDGGISGQWEADDSYWGNHFTAALLGAGYNNSGAANPTGAGISNMELQGGTTFGLNPSTHELLLYLVITNPVPIDGELAIGSDTLEGFPPTPGGGPWGIFPDGSIQEIVIPEPSTLALGSLCLVGLMFRRRRRRA